MLSTNTQRALIVLLLAVGCAKPVPAPVYQAIPVERRDIVVSAQASGSVQPDTTVQVKSKASGEILQILVETGQLVQRAQRNLLFRPDNLGGQNT